MVSVLGSGLAGIGLWPGPLRFVLRQLYGYSASTCLGTEVALGGPETHLWAGGVETLQVSLCYRNWRWGTAK